MTTLDKIEEEILICEALGIEHVDLIANPQLTDSKNSKICEYKTRINNNEPLAYITEHQPFMGLDFFIDRNVLIPRPETELLVEEVINFVKRNLRLNVAVPIIADIGTGSGAIAVSLAKALPNANIIATDISEKALEVAKKNAKKLVMPDLIGHPKLDSRFRGNDTSKHEVIDRITFLYGDLFSPLADQKFDIIVSNSPYIPTEEIDNLEKNVKDYEPRVALDGGKDGLDIIRKIIANAKDFLNPNGCLFLEIGFGQANEVKDLLLENNYTDIEIIKDYAGIERVVKAVKPSPIFF